MKFLLSLMLVGTVAGYGCGLMRSMLKGNAMLDAAQSDTLNPYKVEMNAVLKIVEKYTTCDVLSKAFEVTQSDNCKPIFDAGFCFGVEVTVATLGATEATHWNSYNGLMPDMENLATLACAHASECSDDVVAFAKECFGENDEASFLAMGEELANYYEDNFAAEVASFETENALMKQILDMVMSKFTDFNSVVAFARKQITDARVADAIAKKDAILGIASDFCDEGCVSETAAFVVGITSKMASSKTCADATKYCGEGHNGCKRAANKYIAAGNMPCCLFGTITDVIEQAEALIASYGTEANAALNALVLELNDDAKVLYDQYKATALQQWTCVKVTWTKAHGEEDQPICADSA